MIYKNVLGLHTFLQLLMAWQSDRYLNALISFLPLTTF